MEVGVASQPRGIETLIQVVLPHMIDLVIDDECS